MKQKKNVFIDNNKKSVVHLFKKKKTYNNNKNPLA